jgi:4-amino-4-deoxy-L-arabinose transferase-like glycosyltransferase
MKKINETSRTGFNSPVLWIALLLCLLGIVTRIPFRSQILHHWDSVNFALALDHYDVRLDQPHPPGTFVIYIFLGRLVNDFLHDPNRALVWLSVILSGLGIASFYLLGNVLFGHKVAFISALLVLTSPLIWFHGEVALSYMLEFFWVPLIIYFCYRMETRSTRDLLISALLIGLAGGIRPNTPVFLFPLWILAVLYHRYSWKKTLLALVVMGIGVLIWAVPMVSWSGGLKAYIETMKWWQSQHTETSGSLTGIVDNTIRFIAYETYTLGLGIFPLGIAAFLFLPKAWTALRKKLSVLAQKIPAAQKVKIFVNLQWDWKILLMVGWLLPGTVYLIIIHLHQPGHTFTVQPGFILLTGLAIAYLPVRPQWKAGLTAAVVAVNALFFLAAPTYLFGDTRMLFTTPSWNTIHDYDSFVTLRLEAIRGNFSPLDTAVFASGRNFRLPDYYLKDYQIPGLSHQVNSQTVTLTEPIRNLVIFDDFPLDTSSNIIFKFITLPNGKQMRYLSWNIDQVLEVTPNSLLLRSK